MLNAWFHVCPSVPVLCLVFYFGYFTSLLQQLQVFFKTMEKCSFFLLQSSKALYAESV